MNLSDFDYNLPEELIAQTPIEPRDLSRLLVLDKESGTIKHEQFFKIENYLQPDDLLIMNNSKVIPARLLGQKKESGGNIEVFLIKKIDKQDSIEIWECLLKGRIKLGLKIILSNNLEAEVLAILDDGIWEVKFNLTGADFMSEIEQIGQMPLPPYIKGSQDINNQERYQTVYADQAKAGSVAAPTAGLHFTPELLNKIKAKGVEIDYLTLHVGLGTFRPVKVENILEHKMHAELVEITPELIKKIFAAKQAGRRIVAVGTTTARSLEAMMCDYCDDFLITGFTAWVDIFIYPPYQFKVVNGLITNFHLPKSTLLMLVSALAGKKNIEQAYQVAIVEKYRFFSYGDAMFIN